MTSSLVRFIVYTAGFLLVGAIIYFFVFLRPNANRIEALEQEIAAAHIELDAAIVRGEMHPQLRLDVDRLSGELDSEESAFERVQEMWQNGYVRFLPATFDDADMRQRIERIAGPYSEGLNIDFHYSQPMSVMNYNENNPAGLPEGVWLTPVDVSFYADYNGTIAILNGFAHEGIDNRIVEYSLNRQGNGWHVFLRIDMLTQTPSPHRFNGNYVVYSGTPTYNQGQPPHEQPPQDQHEYDYYHYNGYQDYGYYNGYGYNDSDYHSYDYDYTDVDY